MQNRSLEKFLLWGTRIGIWILLFLTPLVISGSLFFPFITGKNFFFRIVVELVFGVWAALAIMQPRYRPHAGPIIWTFSIFVGILVIAGIFGADVGTSFWSNFERMEGIVTHLHLLALFLMTASVFRTRQDWIQTFHITIAASVVVAFIGLLEKTGSIAIPGASPGRVFSTLGNPIYLALYLLIHMFLLGVLARWITQNWVRIAYGFVFLFEFYIFVASGTRGAVVGFAIGSIVGFLLFLLITNGRRIKIVGFALLMVGLIGIGGLFAFQESTFIRSRPLLARFASISVSSATAQSRFTIWRMAWEGFKERPILGWGPGNFIIPYAKYYNPNLFGNEPWFDRVHNMHFEWLVTTGIVGFFAYGGMWIAIVISLWRLWKQNVFDSVLFSIFSALFVAYLVQNSFVFDTVVSYMLITMLFAFLHSLSLSDNEEKKENYSQNVQQNRMIAGGFIVMIAIFIASTAHAKQIQVARGIIETLQQGSHGTVLNLVERFDRTVGKGTYGVTEARERFMDLVLQATRDPNASGQDLLLLVTKSIDEMEKQVVVKPQLLRHQISLGKLYQLRFALTGNTDDRDKSLDVYAVALEMAPHYPPTYIGLAETYLTDGNNAEATRVVDAIYQEMTRPNALIYSVLLVSVISGDFETATRQLERYKSLGNTRWYPRDANLDPEKTEDIVRRSFIRGEPAEREQFLETVLSAIGGQSHIVTFLALADTKLELGKINEAYMFAERALEAAPPEGKREVQQFIDSLPVR